MNETEAPVQEPGTEPAEPDQPATPEPAPATPAPDTTPPEQQPDEGGDEEE